MRQQLITVYTLKFYDEDKGFIYETKGFLTKDAAIRHGFDILQGPNEEGIGGIKYFSTHKYYKLED